MRGHRWAISLAVCFAAGPGGVLPAPAPPFASPVLQEGDFYGFRVGEERHYTLGPSDALQRREEAVWMIRLERLAGAGAARRGVFVLEHRRQAPRWLEDPPAPGSVLTAHVDGELTVNADGAPLVLVYTSRRDIYDVGEELFEVRYEFDDRRYRKEVSIQGATWDYDVDVLEHPAIDGRTPSGVVAFAPAAADCFEWSVNARFERRLGTGDTSPRQPEGAAPDPDDPGAADAGLADPRVVACNELNTDPAFANPGLLSLAMPEVWAQRGDAEIALFAPLRPELVRATGSRVPVTFAPIIPSFPNTPGSNPFAGIIPGLDFTRLFGGARTEGDADRARDPSRHFFVAPMRLSERQRIEIGPRTSEALPLSLGSLGRAYVDDWGKVLRLDAAAAGDGPPRYIRLLHANEY